jgi:hypothetical protein
MGNRLPITDLLHYLLCKLCAMFIGFHGDAYSFH